MILKSARQLLRSYLWHVFEIYTIKIHSSISRSNQSSLFTYILNKVITNVLCFENRWLKIWRKYIQNSSNDTAVSLLHLGWTSSIWEQFWKRKCEDLWIKIWNKRTALPHQHKCFQVSVKSSAIKGWFWTIIDVFYRELSSKFSLFSSS